MTAKASNGVNHLAWRKLESMVALEMSVMRRDVPLHCACTAAVWSKIATPEGTIFPYCSNSWNSRSVNAEMKSKLSESSGTVGEATRKREVGRSLAHRTSASSSLLVANER